MAHKTVELGPVRFLTGLFCVALLVANLQVTRWIHARQAAITPTMSVAPMNSPSSMATLGLMAAPRSGGEVIYEGELTLDEATIGTLRLAVPTLIYTHDRQYIRAELSRDPPFDSLPIESVPALFAAPPPTPTLVLRLSDRVGLFPVASATVEDVDGEVSALDPTLPSPRILVSAEEAAWAWSLEPQTPGMRYLTFTLTAPVLADPATGAAAYHILKRIPFEIAVMEPPPVWHRLNALKYAIPLGVPAVILATLLGLLIWWLTAEIRSRRQLKG